MKIILHKGLSPKKWNSLTIFEQMANVGAEVGRTISWRKKGNLKYSKLAFERVLELLDLTIADKKNHSRLKELCRIREALADYFVFDNVYQSTDKAWQKYFYSFNFAARINH